MEIKTKKNKNTIVCLQQGILFMNDGKIERELEQQI